jgi:hypothetical protein
MLNILLSLQILTQKKKINLCMLQRIGHHLWRYLQYTHYIASLEIYSDMRCYHLWEWSRWDNYVGYLLKVEQRSLSQDFQIITLLSWYPAVNLKTIVIKLEKVARTMLSKIQKRLQLNLYSSLLYYEQALLHRWNLWMLYESIHQKSLRSRCWFTRIYEAECNCLPYWSTLNSTHREPYFIKTLPSYKLEIRCCNSPRLEDS